MGGQAGSVWPALHYCRHLSSALEALRFRGESRIVRASVTASIPFFTLDAIDLFGLKLQPFGILVAIGVLFGAWLGRKRAEFLGLDDDEIRVMTGYLLVGGFVGAHVFDVLFYQMDDLKKDPLLLIKIWRGISSYGGFLGGVVGFFAFVRRHKIKQVLAYADTTMWGLLPGFTFGRMGCTIVHDHPGRMSDFFLAVNYPADYAATRRDLMLTGGAGPRHNLGLYELLFLLALTVLLVFVFRAWARRRTGFILGLVATAYGPVRFLLDYLRLQAPDPRHLGLTFAQYISVATFLAGVWTLWHIYRGAPAVAAAAADDEEPEQSEPDAPPTREKDAQPSPSAKKKRKGKKKRRK